MTETEARICSRKVLKTVDIRFDENLFKQAWAILKFDQGTETLDKLELTTLVQNLAKIS